MVSVSIFSTLVATIVLSAPLQAASVPFLHAGAMRRRISLPAAASGKAPSHHDMAKKKKRAANKARRCAAKSGSTSLASSSSTTPVSVATPKAQVNKPAAAKPDPSPQAESGAGLVIAQPASTPKPSPSPAPAKSEPAQNSDSPAPSSGGGSGGLSAEQQQTFLQLHNDLRAKHGAAPLTWDDKLASAGESWANKCVFEHSGGSLGPYGENLAAGTGSSYDVTNGFNDWAAEEPQYNPQNPQASHYTQIVWKGSNTVGCGMAPYCSGILGGAKYFVCEYFPAGNVKGSFGITLVSPQCMLRTTLASITRSTSPALVSPSVVQRMSTEALSKLPASVQELVQSTFGTGQASSSSNEAEVSEWIDKIQSGSLVKEDALKPLDEVLTPQTYLVGTEPTAADVALYATLHPIFAKQSPTSLYATPSVTRYFDHIQNLPALRNAAGAPALIPLDSAIDSAPKVERKAAEPTKKKAKKEGESAAAEATKTEAPAAAAAAPPAAAPKEKKEKKEKPKKEAAAAGEPSAKKGAAKGASAAFAADAGEPSPAMIDLRVGHIVDIKRHPDADGLYVEQIDLGEETGPRTIVSGLVNYVPIEQMKDKYLIVVANLKPANMRGVKSAGMVLCATHKDGKSAGIEVVDPPKGSKPGDRVYFEGEKYENVEPLSQLNPKKKIFETIQPGFITLDTKEAAWIDPVTKSVHKIVTKLGPCTAPTFVGASLS